MRRPLRSIDKVVEGFERVIKGDLTAEVKVHTKDELGHLATMFNKMVVVFRNEQELLVKSKLKLEENQTALMEDIKEHEKQGRFLEDSRRATQNLLEDSWSVKEKAETEERRLQAVLSSIGEGLFIVDDSYRLLLVNPVAAEMFACDQRGAFREDLRTVVTLGKKVQKLYPCILAYR